MKRLLLILSLVVVVGATTGAGVRSATAVDRAASNADGAIVFESNRDGDYDIYGMNLDGTGLTQLTKDPLDEGNPLPSPDARDEHGSTFVQSPLLPTLASSHARLA